jgi:hypothetical protein
MVPDKLFLLNCKNGNLENCKYIHEFMKVEINDRHFVECCNEGHIHIMEWICSIRDVNLLACNFKQCYINGHLDVCKWLMEKHGILKLDTKDFKVCCQQGHINVCQWLYDINPLIIFFEIDTIYSTNKKTILIQDYVSENSEMLFTLCCHHSSLNMVIWLHSINNNMNANTFSNCCAHRKIDTCKWILSLHPEYKEYWSFDKLSANCRNVGDLLTWQYIYELYDCPNIDVKIFNTACVKNYVELSQWIYKLHPNIDWINKKLFIQCCENNRVAICKWLIEMQPDLIMLDHGKSFKHANKNGYIEMCQWLYDIKKN